MAPPSPLHLFLYVCLCVLFRFKGGVVPAYLKDRVEQQQPMPMVELAATERGHDEQLRATVALMPQDMSDEWVLGYLLPLWGDKGAAVA